MNTCSQSTLRSSRRSHQGRIEAEAKEGCLSNDHLSLASESRLQQAMSTLLSTSAPRQRVGTLTLFCTKTNSRLTKCTNRQITSYSMIRNASLSLQNITRLRPLSLTKILQLLAHETTLNLLSLTSNKRRLQTHLEGLSPRNLSK